MPPPAVRAGAGASVPSCRCISLLASTARPRARSGRSRGWIGGCAHLEGPAALTKHATCLLRQPPQSRGPSCLPPPTAPACHSTAACAAAPTYRPRRQDPLDLVQDQRHAAHLAIIVRHLQRSSTMRQRSKLSSLLATLGAPVAARPPRLPATARRVTPSQDERQGHAHPKGGAHTPPLLGKRTVCLSVAESKAVSWPV